MNVMIRRKKTDGSLARGESICPEHMAELDPGTFVDTGFPAGRVPCECCRLEEQENKLGAVYVDPEKVTRLVRQVLAGTPEDAVQALQGNAQLVSMLIGFVHALVLVKVDETQIEELARNTLLNVWTRLKEVDGDETN